MHLVKSPTWGGREGGTRPRTSVHLRLGSSDVDKGARGASVVTPQDKEEDYPWSGLSHEFLSAPLLRSSFSV